MTGKADDQWQDFLRTYSSGSECEMSPARSYLYGGRGICRPLSSWMTHVYSASVTGWGVCFCANAGRGLMEAPLVYQCCLSTGIKNRHVAVSWGLQSTPPPLIWAVYLLPREVWGWGVIGIHFSARYLDRGEIRRSIWRDLVKRMASFCSTLRLIICFSIRVSRASVSRFPLLFFSLSYSEPSFIYFQLFSFTFFASLFA